MNLVGYGAREGSARIDRCSNIPMLLLVFEPDMEKKEKRLNKSSEIDKIWIK